MGRTRRPTRAGPRPAAGAYTFGPAPAVTARRAVRRHNTTNLRPPDDQAAPRLKANVVSSPDDRLEAFHGSDLQAELPRKSKEIPGSSGSLNPVHEFTPTQLPKIDEHLRIRQGIVAAHIARSDTAVRYGVSFRHHRVYSLPHFPKDRRRILKAQYLTERDYLRTPKVRTIIRKHVGCDRTHSRIRQGSYKVKTHPPNGRSTHRPERLKLSVTCHELQTRPKATIPHPKANYRFENRSK